MAMVSQLSTIGLPIKSHDYLWYSTIHSLVYNIYIYYYYYNYYYYIYMIYHL